MTPDLFMAELVRVRLARVFNPYSENCPIHDLPNSPYFRRTNLAAALEAAWRKQGGSLWIGRDLGHRGGRRTGLPLTDEIHLEHFSSAWGGLSLRKATAGPPFAERTAAIIWAMLQRVQEPVFLWNLFPFHPYDEGNPLSNRAHTIAERQVGNYFLLELLEALNPAKIVAIGNDAAAALRLLELPHTKVRHPSYGGQKMFCEGIEIAYDLHTAGFHRKPGLPL